MTDSLKEEIVAGLEGREFVTTSQILSEILKYEEDEMTVTANSRVIAVMEDLGWRVARRETERGWRTGWLRNAGAYAAVMQLYKDVHGFLGKRYMSAVAACEKKYGGGEAQRNQMVGAIAYASLVNAVSHLRAADSVLETGAMADLIDGFIGELQDLKRASGTEEQ